jgi:signal transduction histidine kinase/ligand-binding sensor domain-containing protein
VGTNNGLNVLSAQKVDQYDFSFINLIHEYYDSHSILSNDITTFYQEKEGRIWIGSRAGGADFYDNQIKKFYNLFLNPGSPKSLSHNNSTCFAENEEGEIFMGTDGGGIDVLSKDRKTVIPFSQYALFGKLTAKKVISLAFDSKKRLFVGMWGGGVDIFDFKMHTKIHLKKGTGKLDLTSNEFFSLLTDRHGNVWIGTFQHGVNRIDPDLSQVIRLEKSPIINNNASISISGLYEDKRGDIWMTVDPEGICKFDYHTGGLSYFLSLSETQKTLGSFSVLDFFEDRDGRFWIGTRGRGLYLFDRTKNKLITFDLNSKIINEDIFGILEDKNGAIWASSNSGIYKFKSTDIGKSMLSTFRNYDVMDGLAANQFNLLSAFKSRSGEFFFGSVNGATYFKPEEIIDNKYKPEVVFTGLYVFNVLSKPNTKDSPLKKDISESQTIVLNNDQSLFSVEFVGMNFTQPLKNQYKCILEGFEKNWRYLGTEHKVTYSNLDPGTYVLKVIASNNDGLWNEKAATLTIVVLPPWWKETWFKVLAFFLFVALLTIAIRLRFRQLTKHNAELEEKVLIRTEEISKRTEEISKQSLYLETINNELIKSNATKNRLFSIIAHDLRSPFNSLIGIANYLKEYYYELDDTQRHEMISKIEKSSSNFYDLLSNLLLWSMTQNDALKLNPEPVNLLLIIEHAIMAVKGNIDEKHIHLETDLADITIIADNNQIQAIIRNLLSNSIKYSKEGGVISISCREASDDMVEIKVVDHGIGMSEEIQKHLFDSCQIQSQPGTNNEKGTGLGLTIVNDFVTLHKGSIQVDSKPGSGTTFVILLPKQLTQNT